MAEVTKFKVGDVVRRTHPSKFPKAFGETGVEYTVLSISPLTGFPVIIDVPGYGCNPNRLKLVKKWGTGDVSCPEIGRKIRCTAGADYGGIRLGEVVTVVGESQDCFGFTVRTASGRLVDGCGPFKTYWGYVDDEGAASTMTAPATGWYVLVGLNKRIYLEEGQQLRLRNLPPAVNGTVRRTKNKKERVGK